MIEQSEKIDDLALALSQFQGEVENVKKEGENPFFKSKYATLKSTLITIRPVLMKHGLSITQFPSGEDQLTSMLIHSSGQWLKSTAKMLLKDKTPQGQGSGISYMRRYALFSILGIATEDDDANKASKGGKKETVDMVKIEKIIGASKNMDFLIDTNEKIRTSKLYTAEDKKKVVKLIQAQIQKLDAPDQRKK